MNDATKRHSPASVCGMFNWIKHILCLVVPVLALTSCSKDDSSLLEGEGTIIITGIVTDMATGNPLRDIKITFEAYTPKGRLIETKTSYSSSDGIYGVEADGFNGIVNCIMTAEDASGVYQKAKIEINIPWKGTSFNREKGIFVVNDCNFYLDKD